MQAIQTKYLGPTETRGSRISAKCAAGSVTLGYDHALDLESNHVAAAMALCAKLGWSDEAFREISTGQLADGSFVHTFIPTAFVKAKEAVLLTRLAICKGENNGNPHGKPFGRLVVSLTDESPYAPWFGEYEARKAAMYAEEGN
ncbi:hypothetical protein QS468_24895 [Bacillus subtilis]|nr:hypothetical protein [Pseudomonas sp. A29(2023)]MDL5595979.1 hypothetical protein [Bacillus subtilis]